jgi:hypothetical protein
MVTQGEIIVGMAKEIATQRQDELHALEVTTLTTTEFINIIMFKDDSILEPLIITIML